MKNKIPRLMMTQHPDSASQYVSIQNEPKEAVKAMRPMPRGFDIDEVMIDFEGKLTPYHQTSQVVNGLFEKGRHPGKDVFVTPRVANATKETTFKQLMALLSIVETNFLAKKYSSIPAVKEIILPMVDNASEVFQVRKRIEHVIQLAHDEFGFANDKNAIKVIPILEEIPQLIGIKDLFTEYITMCRKDGFDVSAQRYMLARSDPALSYGLVSAVLANKIAIAKGYELEKELDITVSPILGAGSLPFRGHITPKNRKNILKEYSGVRTITIQSGLRYDHPKDKVAVLIRYVKDHIQECKPLAYTKEEYRELIHFIGIFTRAYIESFMYVIKPVCKISDLLPRQRDRLARKSSVGYARDIARPEMLAEFVTDKRIQDRLLKINLNKRIILPRAISFCAALYTIGFPPEFLGLGAGLREVHTMYGKDGVRRLLHFYPSLLSDLKFAGRYLYLKNAKKFVKETYHHSLQKNIDYVRDILSLDLAPQTEDDELYRTLMETVRPMLGQLIGTSSEVITDKKKEMELINEWIVRMGRMRGSLG